MAFEEVTQLLNTNPSQFGELAEALTTIIAYQRDTRLGGMMEDFEHLYRRALDQPPSYREVNELTGQTLKAGDRMAGQAAWLLLNTEQLQVYGVHSLLWHEVASEYSSPLLDQMAKALRVKSQVTNEELRTLAGERTAEKSLIDVVGLKNGNEIWIVQTLPKRRFIESVMSRGRHGSRRLFTPRVFHDPILSGQRLKALLKSARLMRMAFPSVPLHAFCLVQHPRTPDFELYRVDESVEDSQRILLEESRIHVNSFDYADSLFENPEALQTLPAKLGNDLFLGLPPCRAGRTLNILASASKRQLQEEDVVAFKEVELRRMLDQDFSYRVPRDKVRHDLLDRLIGNGFMHKYDYDNFITVKGLARYFYCLAKYTTCAIGDPMNVLNECGKQRDRIIKRFHDI
jgi:hypothetical protein